MQFALINDQRVEAKPGLRGVCPACFQPVVAKCGTLRIHHWSHLNIRKCDSWWEPETEWHRSWKDKFPVGWRETILYDNLTGEKHIADVRTEHGLVIEFQHSHLKPLERSSRENFYGDIVWVVDGMRLKTDYPRFLNGMNLFRPVNNILFTVTHPKDCFPAAWLQGLKTVIFDFRVDNNETFNENLNPLFCLFPARLGGKALVARLPRQTFIDAAQGGLWSQWVSQTIDNINQVERERQQREATLQQQQTNRAFETASNALRYKNKRRF